MTHQAEGPCSPAKKRVRQDLGSRRKRPRCSSWPPRVERQNRCRPDLDTYDAGPAAAWFSGSREESQPFGGVFLPRGAMTAAHRKRRAGRAEGVAETCLTGMPGGSCRGIGFRKAVPSLPALRGPSGAAWGGGGGGGPGWERRPPGAQPWPSRWSGCSSGLRSWNENSPGREAGRSWAAGPASRR